MMHPEHTVKSYDSELKRLKTLIVEMGTLVEQQLSRAIEAVAERDSHKANLVIDLDPEVDQREYIIDQFAVRLLALRQPVAHDLRQVVAALKISSHLERIADYAANVAKRAVSLNQTHVVTPVLLIPKLASTTQSMIHGVLEAYMNLDDVMTTKIWKQDTEVDEMYGLLLKELLEFMRDDPQHIAPCTHVLFMAKNIERIGDHVTNIAEVVHFITHGKPYNEPRPKVEEIELNNFSL